jgi:PAS domain S-box-containing protein
MENSMPKEADSIFRSLMEAAPDGILVVDEGGIIQIANAQCSRLFGYSAEELIGQPIEILVPAYIRSQHAELRHSYFHEPRSRPMGIGLQLIAARRDGTDLPVEISLSPFTFEGKRRAIAIVRDVTELRRLDRELKRHVDEVKRTNAELERSNKELEQFAYVASHDLQEPLRVISGYTQLLQRRYADKLDKNANEYIEFAVDGAKRMQNLINDLLAFSRVSSRAKAFAPVDLNEVLRLATANLRATLDETQGRIDSAPLPIVSGDKTQLTQLFQNLLSNALKFHRDGVPPVIRIDAGKTGAQWTFSVADNGIGISPQYAQKVFVIFQRLHTRDKYPGTGIGLALCKKIVERHGGEIRLESKPNEGTTFIFTLSAKES